MKHLLFLFIFSCTYFAYGQSGSLEDNITPSSVTFLRGSNSIFEDNFENETVGSFPTKWNTNKTGEVKKLNGFANKFLKIAENAVVNIQLKNALPQNFTVELDLIVPDDVPWHYASFGFGSKLFPISWLLAPKEGYVFSLQSNVKKYSEGFKYGTANSEMKENTLKKIDYTTPLNTVIKVAISVNGNQIICFIDGKKMIDQPTAFDASYRKNIFFNASTTGNVVTKLNYFYISNIIIASTENTQQPEVKNEPTQNNPPKNNLPKKKEPNNNQPVKTNNQTPSPQPSGTIITPTSPTPPPVGQVQTPGTIIAQTSPAPPPVGVATITGFHFEQGKNSLIGWKKTGEAFNNQPTYGHNVSVRREMDNPLNPFRVNIPFGGDYWKDLALPIGEKGNYWIGSGENRSDSSQRLGQIIGAGAMGSLSSPTFTINTKFISFLIGGINDIKNATVQLVLDEPTNIVGGNKNNPKDAANDKILNSIFKATGKGSNVMRREWWDVTAYIGKKAHLVITDFTGMGSINVDDFIFQANAPTNTDVVINATNSVKQVFLKDGSYYDWDFPLWGSVDTHTHPAVHLGFGNRLFHGEPVGNIDKAMIDCEINHGGDIFRALTDNSGEIVRGNIVRNQLTGVIEDGHRLGVMDPRNTWGSAEQSFAYWPMYNTRIHQQMWKDWLKRAFDGGVKMIVALTVHNQLFARISEGTRPDDDVSVGNRQMEYMKNVLAPACSDWMEIAYTPMDMRRIMLSNKLVVILGTEIDNIGNFDGRRAPTELEVRTEIRRLYAQGMRYMFPVHLIDNGFGGTAVKNDLFNIATKFNTGNPLRVELQDYNVGFSEFKLKAKFDLLNPVSSAIIDANNKVTAYSGVTAAAPLAIPVLAPAIMPFLPLATTAAGGAIGLAGPLLPIIAGIGVNKWTNEWGISLDALPVGNNYPTYPWRRYAGHINAKGITNAGEVAINEMMKLGIMIDIDHAGRKTVESYFEKAFAVPNGGYPLNSGHNQFCDTRWKESQLMPGVYDLSTPEGRNLYTNHFEHEEEKLGNENDRMTSDLEKIKLLGGMMGVGIAGANVQDVETVVPLRNRKYIDSRVGNNNPGSTQSAAQLLLFAIEKMKGGSVCFGTDVNGFAGLVGPRFGANSASAAAEDLYDTEKMEGYVSGQTNLVAYTPFKDVSGNRFRGKRTGSLDDAINHPKKFKENGKLFSEEDGDFMMALHLFFSLDDKYKRSAEAEETKNHIDWLLGNVVHNAYDKNKIKEFLKGIIKGGTREGIGTDFGNGDVGTQQQIACKVSAEQIFHAIHSDPRYADVINNHDKDKRYRRLVKTFSNYNLLRKPSYNEPLIPSSSKGKTWNYNLDGMAHYGMMVDFFQDLKNVGMSNKDMSVLFNSAEDFARMWERCMRQSDRVR